MVIHMRNFFTLYQGIYFETMSLKDESEHHEGKRHLLPCARLGVSVCLFAVIREKNQGSFLATGREMSR